MSRRRRVLTVLIALASSSALSLPVPAAAATRVVNPGESIQAAIDAANPGDVILLEPGVYRESLEIRKNRITLRGHKATLAPPAHPAPTLCNQFGLPTGICLVGEIDFDTFEVLDPVDHVYIERLKIRDFGGDGILALGTSDLRVLDSQLVANGGYGAFSLAGTGTQFVRDLARGNGDAGFYIGDSAPANALVLDNRSLDNEGEGIFLRSTSFGRVTRNVVSGNCAGILVLGNAPGPATDWTLDRNRAVANNRACEGDAEEGEPGISGIGIALVDTTRTLVFHNTVLENAPSGDSFVSGGIVVINPNEDRIDANTARRNAPADLFWNESGSADFTRNRCDTSSPDGLCQS